MRGTALLVPILFAPLSGALAQAQPVQPGQRVRVTAPAAWGVARQVGSFVGMRGDTLVVTGDSTLACPLDWVDRLDVHRGRKSWTLVGAGIGLVLGAGGGIAFATRDWDFCGPCTGVIPVAIGVGGILLGAGIGAVIKTDRWEAVPLDQLRAQPLVDRRGRRVGLGMSIAF